MRRKRAYGGASVLAEALCVRRRKREKRNRLSACWPAWVWSDGSGRSWFESPVGGGEFEPATAGPVSSEWLSSIANINFQFVSLIKNYFQNVPDMARPLDRRGLALLTKGKRKKPAEPRRGEGDASDISGVVGILYET